MLRLVYTDHALARMRERRIPISAVLALARAGRWLPARDGQPGTYRVIAHRSLVATKRRLRDYAGLVIILGATGAPEQWAVKTAFMFSRPGEAPNVKLEDRRRA